MKIHVHSPCWNEERFLPFYLNHYSFADKIFIHDNGSTDNSNTIISSYGNTEILKYDSNNQIRDDLYLDIKNNKWKSYSSDADWVIVCDIDELLYHHNLLEFLRIMKKNSASVLKPVGFQMFNDDSLNYTDAITDQIKNGSRSIFYDKAVCFSPSDINDINYMAGCHLCEPDIKNGNLVFHSELKLLHYKYIWPLDDILNRALAYKSRMSKYNLDSGNGVQYVKHELLISEYNSVKNKASKVI